jgi:Mrp family chromosome partitioning ATPase
MRTVRERLRFVGRTGVPRCVVFAPATPEAVAAAAPVTAAFARAAAADGEKVLLIEGDLHAPSLARQLGLRSVGGGLTKALSDGDAGVTDWRDAVLADLQPGLDLLLTDSRLADSHALLSGVAFQNLLMEARADYELVVVSAPLPAGSDTVALVQRADAAVLVLDGRSDQTAVHAASSRLVNLARTPLVAVLLSRA